MIVCSFLGHRDIYDADITDRLQAAVERIVNKHNAVEFLLYQHGDFSSQCILAALRVRSIFPEKVRITLVLPEDYFEHSGRNFLYAKRHIPLYMVDKMVMPHIEPAKNEKDSYVRYMRTMQWIIQKSTHLICYLYEYLYEAESRLIGHVTQTPGLEVIDIASEKTVRVIAETAVTLPERERSVYLRMKDGDKLKDIAKLLNISSSRVQQILNSGCQKLRRHLNWKYLKVQFSEKGSRNQSCSIFSAGEITKEKRAGFDRIVDFLIEVYHVRTFYVEDVYIHSDFTVDLKRRVNSYQGLRIVAVTSPQNYPESDAELGDIGAECCPPCHAAVCVGWADHRDRSSLGTIFDMMDLASFCLCDFVTVSDFTKIQQYAAKAKRTVLLDLNRACDESGLQSRSFANRDRPGTSGIYSVLEKTE